MKDPRERDDRDQKQPGRKRQIKLPMGKKDGDNDGDNRWRGTSKTIAFWLILLLIAVGFINVLNRKNEQEISLPFTQFLEQLENGNILEARIVDTEFHGVLKQPIEMASSGISYSRFKTTLPFIDSAMLARWDSAGLQYRFQREGINWVSVLLSIMPWLLFIGIWLFIFRQMQGGPKGVFKFGKSKARLLTEDMPRTTFKDVAGAEEAKRELEEIIAFLREPSKFQKLGGKIPKGALMVGPPGTGKTLLAKAVAGEARVPFFSMSGSDFVEMFVGVGASRVRDLFEQGKKSAPCIIFIDEIDAVGRHRGAGLGGGHDEREQTLNQLLSEMDGFDTNDGVIIMAATNRPDVLDPALLRPGRFDRQVVVDRPDIKGREGILAVHVKKIKLADGVDLKVIARGTPGFSGADLANMVNEAALLAARKNKGQVETEDMEEAKDKVMMGTERRSLVVADDEKRIVAYHESGHALVGWLLPNCDRVHKVTIIPRGRALGLTHSLPEQDNYLQTKLRAEGMIAGLLGGRIAEQLIFGEITSGSSNDIERATTLARKMVCEWGMSDLLGPLTFGKKQEEIFLGREISQHRDYSEETAQLIDKEVKRIVETIRDQTIKLITDNKDKLKLLAETLLEREIIDGDEIDKLFNGETLPPLNGNGDKEKESEPVPETPEPAAEQTDTGPDTGTDKKDDAPADDGDQKQTDV